LRLHFLSGLPRSGSTLLTSILYQNPEIHTEGVSGLCDLMWVASQSVKRSQQWNGNPRDSEHIVRNIPSLYYRDVQKPIVIDKCRAWTLPLNMQMIREYVTPNPKVILCVRPVDDVVQSFQKLFARNKRDDFESSPFASELSMSIAGTSYALEQNDSKTFLVIDFNDLLSNTNEILNNIYNFLELEPFNHDLNNIVNENQEDDSIYGLSGMHDIRKTISI
jgi:sulfotransferase